VGDGSDGMSGDGGEVFDDCESEVAGGRAGRMLIAVSGDSVTSCSSLVPGTCMNICGREGCGRVIVYCGVTDSVGKGESACDSECIGIDESVGDGECVGVDESVGDSECVCIGESVGDSECVCIGDSVGDSECVGVDESVGDSAGVDAVFWSCVELIITASAVVCSC